MRSRLSLIIITLALLAGTSLCPVAAYATPDSIVAAGNVHVSNVSYYPGTFFSGDTGTASYTVTNSNANLGVVVNHAALTDPAGKIRVIDGVHQTSARIGPGKSHTFTFTVVADGAPCFCYPEFSLGFRDADSLYAREKVQIDDSPLILTIVEKPDAYSAGKKKTVHLQVANPRNNPVENVLLRLAGDSADFTPSQVYVGTLYSQQKVPVNFSVTPSRESPIRLALDYDNGDNTHTVAMEIPVVFGTDKKAADPVMSNVQVSKEGGSWKVTGDVNNAGLETANTVIVTALPPAVPEDPYKVYVVGALKPDDFGSFEITFSAQGVETVPVSLSYKDADGNVFETVRDVKIGASGITMVTGESGGSSPMLPVAAAIVILLVFVGGWAYYLRRNKK